MATNADAQRLGFSTPANTDHISEGDDAISGNARAVTDLFNEYRMNRGKIPAGANIRTYTTTQHSGLWHVDSGSAAATITGKPADLPNGAQFELYVMMGASGVLWLFPYGYYGLPFAYVCKVLDATGGKTLSEWTPWDPSDADQASDGTEGAWAAHVAQIARFTAAMGPIDTGGRAAVALRFDHGLANFKTKVLPLTKARGLKVSQAYNPRNWSYAENAGVTAAQLDSWVAAGDVEIWNHSASHAGADTPDALYEQIVTGLAEIEAELPSARGQVWGWNPPGVSTGNYGGYDGGKTPEGWETYAGRLILAHHAVASGSLFGTQLHPLDGQPRAGLARYQMDAQSVASIKAQIDAAIAGRKGLQLMMHPSVLDTSGNLSTAQLTEVLDYLVTKRAAGELVTLSPYELTVADATSAPIPEWDDLIGKPSTFPPATHTHADLVARLAALEYRSGERNITSLLTGVVSGALHVQRIGSTVWLDFRDLVCTDPTNSWHSWSNLLPSGFRPVRSWVYTPLTAQSTSYTAGPVRIGAAGDLVVYGVTGQKMMRGLISFPTPDAPPSTPPGTNP